MGGPRNASPAHGSRVRRAWRRVIAAVCAAGDGRSTAGPLDGADGQQHLRRVYENATEGFFRTTPAGRLVLASPAMFRIFGYPIGADLPTRLDDLGKQLYVEPDRRDEFLRLLTEAGRAEQFEAEMYRADGSRIWASINAWADRGPAGEPLYIEGTLRDVTAHKRAEADRARATAEAAKLALVVRRTHNPVVLTDAQGRVEWANDAWVELTGYPLADFLGRVPLDLLNGPRTDPATVALMRERIAAGQPFEVELLRYARDGRAFWLALDVEVVRDDAGVVRHLVANAEDVTDRKRVQWLEVDRRQLLERVARHEPAESTLAAVCQAVAHQWEGARAAVLRYDVSSAEADACYDTAADNGGDAAADAADAGVGVAGAMGAPGRRWTAAAPDLSTAFVAAIDRTLATGPGVGAGPFTPGDAMAPAETVVADVAHDDRWGGLAGLAAAEGIVASRSVPIVAGSGALLGEMVVLLGPESIGAASDPAFGRAVASFAGLAALAIEHQRLTDRLACQATHDPLTGLPNRARLDAVLPGWLAAAARSGRPLGVLMIDLDGFKHVNDTLGHAAGDALLVQVASRLSAAAREGDVLVRMGGDEFTLLATDLAAPRDMGVIAARLIAALSAPFAVEGRELFITASVGTAAYPADGADAGALVRNADAAMYAAKAAGRNRAAGFDPSMNVAARERLDLEGRLRRMAATIAAGAAAASSSSSSSAQTGNGELTLVYQPQVDAAGRIRGVEALLRWDDPRLGRVCPGKFIPVAETSGLIVPIGTWVLRQACRQAAAWHAAGIRPVSVAVNVSVVQFAQPDFVDVVSAALAEHDLESRWLELELTESVLMANTADAVQKLTAIRNLGVGTAIDDFGTGYSSLAYLRRLPIDQLKIDQSFVHDLTETAGTRGGADTAVLAAIAGLATSLGMEMVAEGVETVAQRDYLARLGCNLFQGYLYSKPLPVDRVEPLLLAGRTAPAEPPAQVAAA